MKLFCLLGSSATGKSTIESIIHEKGILNKIVSTTSRPMRSNETQHEAYHFISKDEFIAKLEDGDFLEHTQYNVAVKDKSNIRDTWYYGIDKTKLDKSKDYIVVVNPRGYRQIQSVLGKDNTIGILIKVSWFKRLIRSFKRDSNANIKELFRRFLADIKDFKGVNKEVNYIIKNKNINKSVGLISNIIHREIT